MPKSKKRTNMWISAEKQKDGKYSVIALGRNYSAAALGRLFDTLQMNAEDNTFMTFPVIRELEDPELMAELDRRIKSIEDGTDKAIPLEDVLKMLKQRTRKRRPKKK